MNNSTKNLLIIINTILLIVLTIVVWANSIDFQNQINDVKWTSYGIWVSQNTLQNAYNQWLNQWQINTINWILFQAKDCQPMQVYNWTNKVSLINIACLNIQNTWSNLSGDLTK